MIPLLTYPKVERGSDSRGYPSIEYLNCAEVKYFNQDGTDFAPQIGKEYFGLLELSTDVNQFDRITMFEAGLVDSSSKEMFLCEKENDWKCPNTYMMNGDFCYKLHNLKVLVENIYLYNISLHSCHLEKLKYSVKKNMEKF